MMKQRRLTIRLSSELHKKVISLCNGNIQQRMTEVFEILAEKKGLLIRFTPKNMQMLLSNPDPQTWLNSLVDDEIGLFDEIRILRAKRKQIKE